MNDISSKVGYALLAFSSFMFVILTYKIIRIPISIVQFKSIMVLLSGICNILLVINITQCSKDTHLREDIQWLPGNVSSGYLLLTLILTFGEHPNCNKMLFGFKNVFQGATCVLPLIAVPSLAYFYYQFSENIKNITDMELQTLWIILMSIIFLLIFIISIFFRKPYDRKGNLRNIDRHRCLALVSLIMDFDNLFPPLRNWSYRKEITIDQESQNCFSLNSVICRLQQDEDESKEENDFEKRLLDKISKMETRLMDEISKIKESQECISQKINEKM
ncbi:unnamed protein product [Meganyctiphanes norvegica]|uniref:Uncharacterized protein n=1 Tax=Meganyctiphanes norvegica TaxID=48144 RepID=A0AAV2RS39_MEGNR